MDFEYSLRPGYLLVTVTGGFDACRARVELGNIVRQSCSSGFERILVDARAMQAEVPVADRYELATRLASMAAGPFRMAILVAESHLGTRMLEDTAVNRGLEVRTTDSLVEAHEYLGLNPRPAPALRAAASP